MAIYHTKQYLSIFSYQDIEVNEHNWQEVNDLREYAFFELFKYSPLEGFNLFDQFIQKSSLDKLYVFVQELSFDSVANCIYLSKDILMELLSRVKLFIQFHLLNDKLVGNNFIAEHKFIKL